MGEREARSREVLTFQASGDSDEPNDSVFADIATRGIFSLGKIKDPDVVDERVLGVSLVVDDVGVGLVVLGVVSQGAVGLELTHHALVRVAELRIRIANVSVELAALVLRGGRVRRLVLIVEVLTRLRDFLVQVLQVQRNASVVHTLILNVHRNESTLSHCSGACQVDEVIGWLHYVKWYFTN